MKKHAIVLICLLALCFGLAACGSGSNTSSDSASNASSAAETNTSTSSNAAASEESSSTASASASSETASESASGDASYELGDRSFCEAYEADGKVMLDIFGEVVNTGSETIVIDSASVCALDENFQDLSPLFSVYVSPNYILPGESAFIYPLTSIELPSSCSVDDEFHMGVNLEASVTDKTITEYALSDVLVYEGSGRPCTGCRVTNETNVSSGRITVVVTYFDSDGQILGVGEKTISDLAPGMNATAVITGGSLPNRCSWDAVADYDLHATSIG